MTSSKSLKGALEDIDIGVSKVIQLCVEFLNYSRQYEHTLAASSTFKYLNGL